MAALPPTWPTASSPSFRCERGGYGRGGARDAKKPSGAALYKKPGCPPLGPSGGLRTRPGRQPPSHRNYSELAKRSHHTRPHRRLQDHPTAVRRLSPSSPGQDRLSAKAEGPEVSRLARIISARQGRRLGVNSVIDATETLRTTAQDRRAEGRTVPTSPSPLASPLRSLESRPTIDQIVAAGRPRSATNATAPRWRSSADFRFFRDSRASCGAVPALYLQRTAAVERQVPGPDGSAGTRGARKPERKETRPCSADPLVSWSSRYLSRSDQAVRHLFEPERLANIRPIGGAVSPEYFFASRRLHFSLTLP